jgi:UDP-N-acetylmuramate--alanine ligase
MSGLALVAKKLGAEVTGSDRVGGSPYFESLVRAGISPFESHAAENVPDRAELVVSTAISTLNPERVVAKERGLKELHRADLLGELTRLKRTIAVTGTHGKTTTSAMVVHNLERCGYDPSFVVGAQMRSNGMNSYWGDGEWLVVEADESDRSLLKLSSEIAVLTNAELDHHTTYSSLEDVFETFRRFLAPAKHAVIWDRPELVALADPQRLVRFDIEDLTLSERGSTFHFKGEKVELRVPGEHNALNATAALTACNLIGVPTDAAARSLESFASTSRRFERLGLSEAGAVVVDDYAHHPTEVAATIAAARSLSPNRVVAVFQPHLFSRTESEATRFAAALKEADVAVVTDIYPARERQEDYPEVTGRLVVDGEPGSMEWKPSFDEAESYLRSELQEGDLCVMLGAGNIDSLGKRLVKA